LKTERSEMTAHRLRIVLDYDLETGMFSRIERYRGFKPDAPVGTLAANGYLMIRVDGYAYLAHRLAWLWVTGSWPQWDIDHMDTNKTNNRFINLRDVEKSTNQQNFRKALSTSVSGMLGVFLARGRWRSRICTEGKRENLGTFDTKQEAHAAYISAKRRLHAGCTL